MPVTDYRCSREIGRGPDSEFVDFCKRLARKNVANVALLVFWLSTSLEPQPYEAVYTYTESPLHCVQGGILGFYVAVVYAIGRAVRAVFGGSRYRLIFDEMPQVQDLVRHISLMALPVPIQRCS